MRRRPQIHANSYQPLPIAISSVFNGFVQTSGTISSSALLIENKCSTKADIGQEFHTTANGKPNLPTRDGAPSGRRPGADGSQTTTGGAARPSVRSKQQRLRSPRTGSFLAGTGSFCAPTGNCRQPAAFPSKHERCRSIWIRADGCRPALSALRRALCADSRTASPARRPRCPFQGPRPGNAGLAGFKRERTDRRTRLVRHRPGHDATRAGHCHPFTASAVRRECWGAP